MLNHTNSSPIQYLLVDEAQNSKFYSLARKLSVRDHYQVRSVYAFPQDKVPKIFSHISASRDPNVLTVDGLSLCRRNHLITT